MNRPVLPPLKMRWSPNVSSRHGQPVNLIVVHRPVGGYEGSIDVLCQPSHEASAHVILGRRSLGHERYGQLEATQLVRWGQKAWACVAYNSRSDNLEISDDAWNGKDLEAWKVAARIVAFRLHTRGLPARWARGGKGAGVCRHYDLGAAGGGHTDPTTSTLQWLRFVARVKYEYRRGGFRKVWGID